MFVNADDENSCAVLCKRWRSTLHILGSFGITHQKCIQKLNKKEKKKRSLDCTVQVSELIAHHLYVCMCECLRLNNVTQSQQTFY